MDVDEVLSAEDHYDVLGLFLDPAPTSKEIRKAYRERALLFHPDKNPSPLAHQAFIAISEAFYVLADDISRNEYDKQLHKEKQHAVQEAERKKSKQEMTQEQAFKPRSVVPKPQGRTTNIRQFRPTFAVKKSLKPSTVVTQVKKTVKPTKGPVISKKTRILGRTFQVDSSDLSSELKRWKEQWKRELAREEKKNEKEDRLYYQKKKKKIEEELGVNIYETVRFSKNSKESRKSFVSSPLDALEPIIEPERSVFSSRLEKLRQRNKITIEHEEKSIPKLWNLLLDGGLFQLKGSKDEVTLWLSSDRKMLQWRLRKTGLLYNFNTDIEICFIVCNVESNRPDGVLKVSALCKVVPLKNKQLLSIYYGDDLKMTLKATNIELRNEWVKALQLLII